MTASPDALSNVPIQVLCLSSTPPLIRNGRVTSREAGRYDVMLAEPEPAFKVGMRVVLDGGPGTAIRIMGVVAEASMSQLRVQTGRVVQPDKRAFPRMYGGVSVGYRVLTAKERAKVAPAWIAGEDKPRREGAWHEPDPFMDFSGSGLKFEDELHCKVGDLLLIELHVAPSDDRWHATGRVVRIEPLRPDDMEASDEEQQGPAPTHQIALQFEHLPQEAREALAAFTLKIQNALLGL
jgi:hypothetical protein